MNERCMLKRSVFLLILLVLLGSLISCTPPTPEAPAAAEAGPRVWIDFPRDGATVPAGASVVVVSHAYAADGVAEVLLSVNSTAYRRDPPMPLSDTLVEVRQEWVPIAPGLYTLQARAYDAAGRVSGSDQIALRVEGDPLDPTAVGPTGVPTIVPTGVPMEGPTLVPTIVPTSLPAKGPTATPTSLPTRESTIVPTGLPTGLPTIVTDVPTAIPEVKVNFWADQTSVAAGECTTLRWQVENATAVFLDGDGVPGNATRQVCPTNTTTYRLRVEAPSGDVERSVTVSVTADTTPPPVPQLQTPADEAVLDCKATQTLSWQPVSDPSGVVYYVKLEREVKAGEWSSVRGWGPVSSTQVEADVDCGLFYRWTVRAQDGAGNISAWSGWYNFSIKLN